MLQTKAEVTQTTKVTKDIFALRLLSPEISKLARPGQFVHLKCGEGQSFILRRPLSIHRVEGRYFELLFQVVGKGTAWLSEVRPHTLIDLIGPIGQGFELKKDLKNALIVAGGIGIAPLFFLASELIHHKTKIFTILGAASQEGLLYYMDMKRISHKIVAATEDGSFGIRGTVAHLLPPMIESAPVEQIYACGPGAMLKAVAQIAASSGIPCQASLDERMACGIGACLACVCKVRSDEQDFEYKRVCVDGPVFDVSEVIWD